MEKIIEKAKELGTMMKESEIAKKFDATQQKLVDDEKAQELIAQFNMARMTLSNESQNENPDPQRLEQIQQKVQSAYEAVMSLEIMQEMDAAGRAMDEMINKVNHVIHALLQGQDPDAACTHDCSTCGGCH